ncbi:choice-of-anchor M domain-containing protein [Leucobacter sp. OH1287]|uniref:choice-of-anchor M domain-containing protein n=1 Tax=Leucobacter sp. OH1287 TaxID=2491049 RepID=UPI000F5E8B38|nr:choice-of-anchor M domain-containing protein [Leucobacter sp. OH1287]RRD61868.1 hypothetical protein EII30_00755 [Leucobacter sp. OH1287]
MTNTTLLKKQRFFSFAALLLVAAIAFAGVGLRFAPLAYALDDKELTVATKIHVDSPKIHWENDALTLKSKIGHDIVPLEKSINHFKEAYNRRGQNFIFTIPEDSPELQFMGQSGENWYMADYNTLGEPVTIWSGFGADAGIPVEQFRDAVFTLDLVSAKGPGRAELFVWTEGIDEYGLVRRMFSTSDPHFSSYLMNPGNHTHNYTVFEKPGRYELTYRATARTKDGKLLASKEQPLLWQVGGNTPGVALDSQTDTRFETANINMLRIGEAPASTNKTVAGKMRQLRVDVPGVTDGTAKFTVNGFHLAEVKVTDGVAQFTEMLGSYAGNYQVVVADTAGEVRWVSESVEFDPAVGEAETSEAGEIAAQQPAPSYNFAATEASFNENIPVTVSVRPGAVEDSRDITVRFGNTGFVGDVSFYSKERADKNVSNQETSWNPGGTSEFTITQPWDSDDEGGHLGLRITPHPLIQNVKPLVLTVTDEYQPGQAYEVSGALKLDGDADSGSVTPGGSGQPGDGGQPGGTVPGTPGGSGDGDDDDSGDGNGTGGDTGGAPSQPGGTDPQPGGDTPGTGPGTGGQPGGSTPGTGQGPLSHYLWGDRILIQQGHLDIAAEYSDGLQLKLHDDSRTVGNGSAVRYLDEVAIAVSDDAIINRLPHNIAQWAGIIDEGKSNWILPQAQKAGLPWPGYSTELIGRDQIPGNLNLEILEFSGPGRMALFSEGGLGEAPQLLLGTAEGQPRSFEIDGRVHAHAGWSFNKPGEYWVSLRYTAVNAAGQLEASVPAELIFVVGSEKLTAATPVYAEVPAVPDPKPQPQPQPEPQPQPGEPGGSQPGTGAAPSTPAPSTPAPSTPAPADPAPSTPAPSNPSPTNPSPTNPAPVNPAPSTPAPGGTGSSVPAAGSAAPAGTAGAAPATPAATANSVIPALRAGNAAQSPAPAAAAAGLVSAASPRAADQAPAPEAAAAAPTDSAAPVAAQANNGGTKAIPSSKQSASFETGLPQSGGDNSELIIVAIVLLGALAGAGWGALMLMFLKRRAG